MIPREGTAVAAPLSLPRRSEAKAGRGAPRENGDSERIREQAPRRDYSPSGIYEMGSGSLARYGRKSDHRASCFHVDDSTRSAVGRWRWARFFRLAR